MKQGLDFHRWRRFVHALLREYRAAGCDDRAASLTYTTLFAVVPVMTVAFAVLRLMPQLAGISERIEGIIFENFMPAAGAQVQQYLAGFAAQATKLTVVGGIFLLATAVMLLMTVERAFNRIWRVDRHRRLWSSLLVYGALLTLGPLLLGSGMIISSYLFSIHVVSETVGRIGGWTNFLIVLPFFFSAVFFSLAYILVPNCPVPVREGIIGGVVASLLLEAARHVFTFIVSGFSSWELMYGAFAAVPLFLLWIHISWAITLFGVVLVHVLTHGDDDDDGAPVPGSIR